MTQLPFPVSTRTAVGPSVQTFVERSPVRRPDDQRARPLNDTHW